MELMLTMESLVASAISIPLIYGIRVLIGCLISAGDSRRHQAYFTCPVLFLLYSKNIEALAHALLLKIKINVLPGSVTNISATSNHFIITLDIKALFSFLLIVLFGKMKISTPSLAR